MTEAIPFTVVGRDVEMPVDATALMVSFVFSESVDSTWTIVAGGSVIGTGDGSDTIEATFPASALGQRWALRHGGQERMAGDVVPRPLRSSGSTSPVEVTLDDGDSVVEVTLGAATGPTGIVAVDGTAADADLVSYDSGTRTLTVDLPDAGDIAGDWSGSALTADNVADAITETMTGVASVLEATHLAAEQAAAARPRLTRWSVSDATEAVSFAERDAANLDMWPDGSIGFASISGTTYGFAANGTASARWTATAGDLLGTVQATASTITTTIPSDYAAGGSIVAQGSGKIVKLYHAEKHATVPGQPSSFLSWLGLAVADESDPDDWTDLGAVITPAVGVDAAMWCDVGGGAACVVDGYLYVYFSDTLTAQYDRVPFAVARCLVADILTWANGGAAAVFHKWHLGAWDEPGIDGDSSPVIVGAPTPNWCDAITLSSHDDRVLLVWSGKLSPAATDTHWGVWCAVSAPGDPLSFGRVETIVEPHRRFYAYPTLVQPDLGGLGNAVAGDAVRLYLTESDVGAFENGGSRWEDAWVSLRTLTWQSGRMTLLGGSAQFFDDGEDFPRLFAGNFPGVGGFVGFGDGTGPTSRGFTYAADVIYASGADLTVVDNEGVGGNIAANSFRPVDVAELPNGLPAGAHTLGQICRVSGLLYVCIAEGDPGTWVPVQHADTGGWQNATLVNSWANVPTIGRSRYRLRGVDEVDLDLIITGGASGSVALTLPEVYRPIADDAYTRYCYATNGTTINSGNVTIATNGQVTVSYTATFPVVVFATRFIRAL